MKIPACSESHHQGSAWLKGQLGTEDVRQGLGRSLKEGSRAAWAGPANCFLGHSSLSLLSCMWVLVPCQNIQDYSRSLEELKSRDRPQNRPGQVQGSARLLCTRVPASQHSIIPWPVPALLQDLPVTPLRGSLQSLQTRLLWQHLSIQYQRQQIVSGTDCSLLKTGCVVRMDCNGH